MSRKYNLRSIWVTLLFVMAILGIFTNNVAIAQNEQNSSAQEQQIETNKNPSTDKEYLNSKVAPKPFDRETWNEKREGLDYSDKKKKEQEKKNTEDGKNGSKSGNGDEVTENTQDNANYQSSNWSLNLGPLAQVIAIVGIIMVLALLVFMIIKSGLFHTNHTIKQTITGAKLIENIEDNLHESDLERALRLALESQDYRLAIRIYYLTIIKELSLKDLIKWKRDKTNGQYVREMMEKPGGNSFRALTISFERAWYSNETIMRSHFEALNPQFQSFINSIKKQ